MSVGFAVDFSWARPTPADLVAAGVTLVLRYGAPDTVTTRGKVATADELAGYVNAGLDYALVWEWYAQRCTEGYTAGLDDGIAARAHGQAVGYAMGATYYFAVDEQVDPARVDAYAKGFATGLGNAYRVGVYGDADVCDHFASWIAYRWQTTAWSSGRVADGICLYQRAGYVYISGAQTDADVIILGDYGGNRRPTPPPPQRIIDFKEDYMPGIVTHTGALDDQGNGYLDEPGLDADKVVNVTFNVLNPATQGYVKVPKWGRTNVDGTARIVLTEGAPHVDYGCIVWATA